MKIAFVSDIHGNATALEAVVEDIQYKKVDKIYVLGDLCYRGPEPKRSLDLVRSLDAHFIKGNADEWVVRGVREGEVPDKAFGMMNIERDWTVNQLEKNDMDFLSGIPTEIKFEVEGVPIHAFHATPESLFEVVRSDADDNVLEDKLRISPASQIYIYAHIHKPYIRYINGRTVINTGSVGLPFDGFRMASYAIIEMQNGTFSTSIERVHYDWEKVVEQYNFIDYPNAELMKAIIRNANI